MMFVKFAGVKKLLAVWLKTSTISASATMTGQLPRLPPLTLSQIRLPRLPSGSSGAAAGAADSGADAVT